MTNDRIRSCAAHKGDVLMANDPPMDAFDRGTAASGRQGGMQACSEAVSAPVAPFSAPPDLLIFLRELPVREAASALGLSRGTVYNLREGYWPRDPRRILRAWAVYQGRRANRSSGWFLRRVYPGGLVRHAGREWSARDLVVCTGQTVAVARGASAALLAQMLEPPHQRLELVPALGKGVAA